MHGMKKKKKTNGLTIKWTAEQTYFPLADPEGEGAEATNISIIRIILCYILKFLSDISEDFYQENIVFES